MVEWQQDASEFCEPGETCNYKDTSESLPVFCVSSRAFQSLRGHLRNKNPIRGFDDVHATEIPQLVLYAKKLTEPWRVNHLKSFLHETLEILNSLQLWSADNSSRAGLTDTERNDSLRFVETAVKDLEQVRCKTSFRRDLRLAADRLTTECDRVLMKKLLPYLDSSMAKAIRKAPSIADRWHYQRGNEQGLRFPSYKAICHRK
jgi:hypothetical protein